MLLICDWSESEPSGMTARLLTWGEGEPGTEQLSTAYGAASGSATAVLFKKASNIIPIKLRPLQRVTSLDLYIF